MRALLLRCLLKQYSHNYQLNSTHTIHYALHSGGGSFELPAGGWESWWPDKRINKWPRFKNKMAKENQLCLDHHTTKNDTTSTWQHHQKKSTMTVLPFIPSNHELPILYSCKYLILSNLQNPLLIMSTSPSLILPPHSNPQDHNHRIYLLFLCCF